MRCTVIVSSRYGDAARVTEPLERNLGTGDEELLFPQGIDLLLWKELQSLDGTTVDEYYTETRG